MSFADFTLDYLLRCYDEERLKTIIKGYTIQIEYYEGLKKEGVAGGYLEGMIRESKSLRIIAKRALKIKQSEVKNVSNSS